MYIYDSTKEVNKLWLDLGFSKVQTQLLDCKAHLNVEMDHLGFEKDKFCNITLDTLLIFALEQGLNFRLEVFDGNKEQVDNSETPPTSTMAGSD